MPERRPEPHRKKPQLKKGIDMEMLRERLGEAWMARIDKEIRAHEPNISPDDLEARRHQVLKLMHEEIKKSQNEGK